MPGLTPLKAFPLHRRGGGGLRPKRLILYRGYGPLRPVLRDLRLCEIVGHWSHLERAQLQAHNTERSVRAPFAHGLAGDTVLLRRRKSIGEKVRRFLFPSFQRYSCAYWSPLVVQQTNKPPGPRAPGPGPSPRLKSFIGLKSKLRNTAKKSTFWLKSSND